MHGCGPACPIGARNSASISVAVIPRVCSFQFPKLNSRNSISKIESSNEMAKYSEESKVKWKWGNGYGHGKVQSSFTKSVTRKIDGSEVTRNGSEENPAYYVNVDDGNNVLKLESELQSDS